jgi:hypothetical protein
LFSEKSKSYPYNDPVCNMCLKLKAIFCWTTTVIKEKKEEQIFGELNLIKIRSLIAPGFVYSREQLKIEF